jgi:hypothetical protein
VGAVAVAIAVADAVRGGGNGGSAAPESSHCLSVDCLTREKQNRALLCLELASRCSFFAHPTPRSHPPRLFSSLIFSSHRLSWTPLQVRLVRVSGTLITQFRKLLVTECEIFVSILIRFLDHDKPVWQRALVLEVVHELCAQPELLESFSLHYDMQSKSTKVCVEIFTLLCARHAGPQHLVRSDLTLAFAYGASDSRRVHTYLQSSSRPFSIISPSLSLFFACITSCTRARALCMRSSSPALPSHLPECSLMH